ncbi:MAG TPA: HlyD family secretion protein [Chthoniobacterales bacterium]|jgi:membrane fusion protein (multidrug efflux system)|nr:HlyD family secretion protein [Chthoniobacterales bacterium]
MKTLSHGTSSQRPEGTTIALREQTPDVPLPEGIPNKRGNRLILWVMLPLAVLAAGGGFWFWMYSSQFESTDNAYVTGHEHPVSFRVAGTISEVLVEDNQVVKKGDPIARLDPRVYEVALAQARASYLQAKAQLEQVKAQVPIVQAQLAQAQAQADAAKANSDYLQRNLQRNSQLSAQGAVSKQDFDNARSQANNSVESYKAQLAAVNVAKENLKVVSDAQVKAAAAQVDVAFAQVQTAELNLSFATVYASTDGRVSQKTFEVGQYVQAGQGGLSIAEPRVWIVANFKENQLGRIRAGQPVEIHVDAISNHTFLGTVESFQAGTGAVYALLPPDNATGNFTKIVQRVPVKIRFEPESVRGYEQLLVAGLSTEPKIRVTKQ